MTFFISMILACLVQVEQRPSKMVSVCIADVSSSMGGQRLATTKAELLAFAEQAPPSNDHIVVLVPFSSGVNSAMEYRDKAKFQAAVNALVAGGGSNIAAGLRAGRMAASKYGLASQLLVMLYSDGEGDSPEAIRREEAELAKLFRSRHAKSLANHVALKRWGNASSELRTRLENNPAVNVTDAAALKIRPAVVNPKFNLVSARRDKLDPSKLEVEFQANVNGRLGDKAIALTLDAICLNPGAKGDVKIRLRNQVASRNFRVILPITTAQQKDGAVDVAFRLSVPKVENSTIDGVLLPLMKNTITTMNAKIPPAAISVTVVNELNVKKAVSWDDALAGRAIVEAEIKVTRSKASGQSGDEGILRSRLKLPRGIRILSGPPEIVIPKSGSQVHQYKFSVPKRPGSNPPVFDLVFDFLSKADSPLTRLSPASHRWSQPDIPAPPPQIVPVNAQVVDVSPAKRLLLPDLCLVKAKLKLEVDGRIPASTTLMIAAPPNVKKLKVSPTLIHEGEQLVTMLIWVELPPHPKLTKLQFDMSAMSPLPDQIQLKCPANIAFSVAGPQPVVFENSGHVSTVTVADNASEALVAATITAAGADDPRIARGWACETHWSVNGSRSQSQKLELFTPTALSVQLPAGANQSFFRSQPYDVWFELRPDPPTTAVLPSRFCKRIVRRPPFVRYLLYFSCVAAPFTIALIVGWLVRRLRTTETLFREENDEHC